MRVSQWHVVPTDPGSGWGGAIRWRAHVWGVEVEADQWRVLASTDEVPELQTQRLRLPWKTIAQMLITRDEVWHL